MNPAHEDLRIPGLDAGESFIYQWQYGMFDKSDFAYAFCNVMAVADEVNLDLLHMGFPKEIDALRDYQSTEGWWPRVEETGQIAMRSHSII